MPTSASFVQHSLDLLAGVGPVRSRAMFGGYGLSLNGISIGIIDDDRMYLRVDDDTRSRFQDAGAQPFTYPSKKGPMVMNSYWSLPDEAIDDPDVAISWGRLAVDASLRGEAKKKKKKPAAEKAASAKPPAPAKKAAAKKPVAKRALPRAGGKKKTSASVRAKSSRAR